MVLQGQLYSQFGALIAGLNATNLGVMGYLRVVAIQALSLGHIAVNNVGILTMHHDRHLGGREDLFQRLTTIYEHVTR